MIEKLVFGRMLADILTRKLEDYTVTYDEETQNEDKQVLYWVNTATGLAGCSGYYTKIVEKYLNKQCTLRDVVRITSKAIEMSHDMVQHKEESKLKKQKNFDEDKENIRIMMMKTHEYPDKIGNSVYHVVCPNENVVAVAVVLNEKSGTYEVIDLRMPRHRWGKTVDEIKNIAIQNSKEHGVCVTRMSHKFNMVPFLVEVLGYLQKGEN